VFVSYVASPDSSTTTGTILGVEYEWFHRARILFEWKYDFLGFGWEPPDRLRSRYQVWFALPLWFVLTLTAALPSIRLVGFVRRKRLVAEGLCVKCGYDLRATPHRCPECGTVPMVTPPAAG
jgi:hypothetical protein